jgi:hypothetical protein
MGLFEGNPTCRFCRKEAETAQRIICGCEVLTRQRYCLWESGYRTEGHQHSLSTEPVPLYTRHRATECVLNVMFRVAQAYGCGASGAKMVTGPVGGGGGGGGGGGEEEEEEEVLVY